MEENRIEVTKRVYSVYIRGVRDALPEYARPTFDRLSRPAQEMAARRTYTPEVILDEIERRMSSKKVVLHRKPQPELER
jgi:hypothetical protein